MLEIVENKKPWGGVRTTNNVGHFSSGGMRLHRRAFFAHPTDTSPHPQSPIFSATTRNNPGGVAITLQFLYPPLPRSRL